MKFLTNPLLVAELEHEEAYHAFRKYAGEQIKANVEAIAPVGSSGQYHESIRSDDDGSVGTIDPFGHLVEWGSVNNSPYAPIRRGVAATGLALHEEDH